jgi:ABC-type sugar transport system permease subunit
MLLIRERLFTQSLHVINPTATDISFCTVSASILRNQSYLSFVKWDMLTPVKIWVGLENYRFLFTQTKFRLIMLNTLIFTIASVVLTGSIGLAMVKYFARQHKNCSASQRRLSRGLDIDTGWLGGLRHTWGWCCVPC